MELEVSYLFVNNNVNLTTDEKDMGVRPTQLTDMFL